MLRAIHCQKEAALWNKFYLYQYQYQYQYQYEDSILVPPTHAILHSDVFCYTPNLHQALISPCADDLDNFEKLTHLLSIIITFLVDSIDVLYNYKSILDLTGEAVFFNSRYNRLDPSTSLYKSILVQACHLSSKYFTIIAVLMILLTLHRRFMFPPTVKIFQLLWIQELVTQSHPILQTLIEKLNNLIFCH